MLAASSRVVRLRDAYCEDLEWDLGGHTWKGSELLLGGEVIVVVEIALLQSGLALGMQVVGRGCSVKLRMLALRIARCVDEARVQAYSLLWGTLANVDDCITTW
jgi:hypothetical protein